MLEGIWFMLAGQAYRQECEAIWYHHIFSQEPKNSQEVGTDYEISRFRDSGP